MAQSSSLARTDTNEAAPKLLSRREQNLARKQEKQRGFIEYFAAAWGRTPSRVCQKIADGTIELDEAGRPAPEALRRLLAQAPDFLRDLASATDALLFERFSEGYAPSELVVSLAKEGHPLSARIIFAAWEEYKRMEDDPRVVELRARREEKAAREQAAALAHECEVCGRSGRRARNEGPDLEEHAPPESICKCPGCGWHVRREKIEPKEGGRAASE